MGWRNWVVADKGFWVGCSGSAPLFEQNKIPMIHPIRSEFKGSQAQGGAAKSFSPGHPQRRRSRRPGRIRGIGVAKKICLRKPIPGPR